MAPWIFLRLTILGGLPPPPPRRTDIHNANPRPKTCRARNDEGRAPAGESRERRGNERCAPDADAAEQPVQSQGPPVVLGIPHQPGNADRMIDRAEEADQREADGDAERAGRKTRQNGGKAAADIEDHHHVFGAPAVAEPACRQRAEAVESGSGH